jgi:predicted AAA+ superfamily ATPase
MQKLFLRSQAALQTIATEYRRPLYEDIDWSNPLIAVIGARGVGKTTLLLQRLQALKLPAQQALYVDLGDLYFQENRLLDFAEAYIEQGGKYLFLDEVHRYGFGQWAQELKTLYDLYRKELKVVFSGSSLVNILDQQADLSRRVRFYRMQGLSFREYLLLKLNVALPVLDMRLLLQDHEQIAASFGTFRPIPALRQYWQTGYYPFFLEDEAGYAQRLNLVVQLVIDQDIALMDGVSAAKSHQLGRLLYAIASSPPFKPNISKLAERLGLSRNTLLQYLQLLERAELIGSLRTSAKGVSALQKPDKLYLNNPNLVYTLSSQAADIGTLRETFFYNQLTALTHQGAVPAQLLLPKKGDFLLSLPEQDYWFEVGGPNKEAKQIGTAPHHYVVVDAASTAHPQRIPLWMFGLLY